MVNFPGTLLPTANGIFHLQQMGKDGPTVIMESGLAATSLSWVLVQSEIAKFAGTVSYDRAGLGFSPPSRGRHSVHQLIEDLNAIILETRLPAPYILVGHSFGALLVQAYAYAYPKGIAGMVLLDPVSLHAWARPTEQDLQRLTLGAKLCRRGAFLARVGIAGMALSLLASGRRYVPALIGRISAGKGSSVMARLASEVAKLPAETHPLIRAHWSRPGSFVKLAEYLEGLPAAACAALEMRPPSTIPLTILSAATATANELLERDGWIAQRPGSHHTVVVNTTHWIQLDRPDAVISSVWELTKKI